MRQSVPGVSVVYRDLAAAPLSNLTLAHLPSDHPLLVMAEDTDERVLRESRQAGQIVLDEFLAADAVVIGAPMYNFSVSSQLKRGSTASSFPADEETRPGTGGRLSQSPNVLRISETTASGSRKGAKWPPFSWALRKTELNQAASGLFAKCLDALFRGHTGDFHSRGRHATGVPTGGFRSWEGVHGYRAGVSVGSHRRANAVRHPPNRRIG